MMKPKFFDKYQLIIAIIGIASFVLSIIFYFWMISTATPQYVMDADIIEGYTYALVPSSLYSIFASIHFITVVWFIVRSITFKSRLKEYEESLLL